MSTSGSRLTSRRPTRDQIAAAACHLYIENGGNDEDLLPYWIRAEELLVEGSLLSASPMDGALCLRDRRAARALA
jgi:hypothetical protein